MFHKNVIRPNNSNLYNVYGILRISFCLFKVRTPTQLYKSYLSNTESYTLHERLVAPFLAPRGGERGQKNSLKPLKDIHKASLKSTIYSDQQFLSFRQKNYCFI